MKLYIANATKQHIDFMYRTMDSGAYRRQPIPIGQQIQISGDLTAEDVEMIVKHHSRYGMIPAEKVNNSRTFNGLCYSVDKPVKMDSIQNLIELNTDVLIQRGKQMRQEAALATSSFVEAKMNNEFGDGAPGLREMEMSVVEENPDERSSIGPIAEGYRILPDGGEQNQYRRGNQRRR